MWVLFFIYIAGPVCSQLSGSRQNLPWPLKVFWLRSPANGKPARNHSSCSLRAPCEQTACRMGAGGSNDSATREQEVFSESATGMVAERLQFAVFTLRPVRQGSHSKTEYPGNRPHALTKNLLKRQPGIFNSSLEIMSTIISGSELNHRCFS